MEQVHLRDIWDRQSNSTKQWTWMTIIHVKTCQHPKVWYCLRSEAISHNLVFLLFKSLSSGSLLKGSRVSPGRTEHTVYTNHLLTHCNFQCFCCCFLFLISHRRASSFSSPWLPYHLPWTKQGSLQKRLPSTWGRIQTAPSQAATSLNIYLGVEGGFLPLHISSLCSSVTPDFSCMKQSALQYGSFLTRLHLSMKLPEVYNSSTKCLRTFHITPLGLEKGIQHQSMLIPIYSCCQWCWKARMPPDLRMKIWILRLFPHFNSLLMLSQGGCASMLLSVRKPWKFLCFLWAQGWASRAALFIELRGSTDHARQWAPVVDGQSWKFSNPYSSEKPDDTTHRKWGGPETKLCLTKHIASDFPVPRFR